MSKIQVKNVYPVMLNLFQRLINVNQILKPASQRGERVQDDINVSSG